MEGAVVVSAGVPVVAEAWGALIDEAGHGVGETGQWVGYVDGEAVGVDGERGFVHTPTEPSPVGERVEVVVGDGEGANLYADFGETRPGLSGSRWCLARVHQRLHAGGVSIDEAGDSVGGRVAEGFGRM